MQKLTRLPHHSGQAIRPGDEVQMAPERAPHAHSPECLCGKWRRVKSLTCAITHAKQPVALWRVHFTDGRCVEAHRIVAHRPQEAQNNA